MTQQQTRFASMELFLIQTKYILSNLHKNKGRYKTIRVVMGDKTCDLDSAICTLAQGLFEHVRAVQHTSMVGVIPVMNVTENEFHLKTEVLFWLELHKIPLHLLTFRNHIDLQDMQNRDNVKLELILVDHHTLPDEDISLKSSVVKIIDHRQQDISWPWHNVSLNIKIVASCATLVARHIILHECNMLNYELSSLLRGPILVDTGNMLDKIGHFLADADTLELLEFYGGLTTDRTEIFDRIMEAKSDISELSCQDLLIKDLKVISDIPIVVLPLLVEDFLAQSDAKETIKNLYSTRDTVTVLLGVQADSDDIFRDIAFFYGSSNNDLGRFIRKALIHSENPNLQLKLIESAVTIEHHMFLYKQENIEGTRKIILPMVQKAKLMYPGEQ